jgi:hypothetical protein
LVELGERFRSLMPDFVPFFVNLPTLAPDLLVTQGGVFGQVLRLVRGRKARPEEFRRLLESAVANLEAMPEAQRLRWLELLSYMHALVYHERNKPEHRDLQEVIEGAVMTDAHRREVRTMHRTIAEGLKAEGRRKGRKEGALQARRQTLLRQLGRRFGDIPEAIAAVVNACSDVEQLDKWLDNFATARSLQEVGINGAS